MSQRNGFCILNIAYRVFLLIYVVERIKLIVDSCIIYIDCNNMLCIAIIPSLDIITIEVTTTPYSAEISWATPYIVLDKETYTVQYSTDISLQNRNGIVIEAINEFSINLRFSVNITELIPFTTYYYIIQAYNSAGNTSTDVMTFITSETGTYVHIKI